MPCLDEILDSSGRKNSSRRYFDLKQPTAEAEPACGSPAGGRGLAGGAAIAGLAVGSGAFRGASMVWAQNIKDDRAAPVRHRRVGLQRHRRTRP